MGSWLKGRLLRFRRDAVVLAYAARNPATPRHLRLGALAALLYLLSPIDLIPATFPFISLLDDALILPFVTARLSARLPETVRLEAEKQASGFIARWFKRPLLVLVLGALALLSFWALVLWLLWRAFGA